MSPRGFCWVLLLFVPVYAVLAATVPPFDDELYYWCWSRDLQLSYYDHPPMVAYLIRASTELFGNGLFAIRLPAVLSALVVAAVVWRLSRPRGLLAAVFLTPAMTFGAIIITPDTPLLMFWALYLLWLVAVHERLAAGKLGFWWWPLGGAILGCAVLGKYTAGLAGVAGGVSFLFAGPPRRWAAGYVVHAAVAVLVASPILIHNLAQDFTPLRYQWRHTMTSRSPGLASFGDYVGGQALLFGLVPFVVFVWAIRHRAGLLANPRLRVCACLFAIPFAFFLFKATRGRVEANWSWGCYLACWPLACEWYRQVRESAAWRCVARVGLGIPIAASVVLLVHRIEPIPLVPVPVDRVTCQFGKMEVAREVAADLRAAGYAGPVYAPSYQWTAVLRWHGIDARQVRPHSRPSHFTERPGLSGEVGNGVVFSEGKPGVASTLGPGRAACYPLTVRDRDWVWVWVTDRAGPGEPRAFSAGPGRLDPPPPLPPR